MRLRYAIKLLKITLFTALLVFVGVMGFFYLSDEYNAYTVLSDSMRPALNSGDLVLVGSPDHLFVNRIEPGNIVTYQRNEALITHRVVSVMGDRLVTKGDALEDPDPWQVSRLSDVKGCYITRIPYLGYLKIFIRTKIGWFMAIILPTIFLLGLIIKEIIKESFRDDQKIRQKGGLAG